MIETGDRKHYLARLRISPYRPVFTAIASMYNMYTVLFLQSRKNFDINTLRKRNYHYPKLPERFPAT
jgi:hypothetical protein